MRERETKKERDREVVGREDKIPFKTATWIKWISWTSKNDLADKQKNKNTHSNSFIFAGRFDPLEMADRNLFIGLISLYFMMEIGDEFIFLGIGACCVFAHAIESTSIQIDIHTIHTTNTHKNRVAFAWKWLRFQRIDGIKLNSSFDMDD